MARAAADPLHLNGRPADETWLTRPVIDLVSELEVAGIAVGVPVPVVGERRAAGLDGRSEDLPHGVVEPLDGTGPERGRGRLRVDPGLEERLVGVDIADAGDPRLVEEEALDAAPAPLQDGPELGQVNFKRLGAQAGQLAARGRRIALDAEQEAELADVAEAELVAAVAEADDEPRVFVSRRPLPREQELAGHLEVEDERPPALDLDEEHLAAPADSDDAAAAQRLEPLPPASPEQGREEEVDPRDGPALEARRERTGDRLDFGEFRHGAILAESKRTGNRV